MPMSSSLPPAQAEDRAGSIYLDVKILFVETSVNSPAVPFPIEAPGARHARPVIRGGGPTDAVTRGVPGTVTATPPVESLRSGERSMKRWA